MRINKYLFYTYVFLYKFYYRHVKKYKWELRLEHFNHNSTLNIYSYQERDLGIDIFPSKCEDEFFIKFKYISEDTRHESAFTTKDFERAMSMINTLYFRFRWKDLIKHFQGKLF